MGLDICVEPQDGCTCSNCFTLKFSCKDHDVLAYLKKGEDGIMRNSFGKEACVDIMALIGHDIHVHEKKLGGSDA